MSPKQRKANSEEILRREGVPTLDMLPLTEADEDVILRSSDEVAHRILCLFCLTGTAYNEGDTSFVKYLEEHNLWGFLSDNEREYLNNPTYGDQAETNVTWRLEALFLLAWATSLVKDLPLPRDQVVVDLFIDTLPRSYESPSEFISSLKIRPVSELMDASDLIYRMHWATRNHGDSVGLDSGIVQEWHHAINWVTNYDSEPWDLVASDT